MSMRKQLVTTVEATLVKDEKLVVLLGDIGVFGFRGAAQQYPSRVYNIGILEQSTVSVAAGLAMVGYIPVVHTIAPFLVERCTEQLKDDFGYQRLGGNFISVGASYDYAALGPSHHCPGDVAVLSSIPTMEIVIPGTAAEFDRLFKQAYANGRPTYYRLTERENPVSHDVVLGRAEVIKVGTRATVIAVGPMLRAALEATEGADVTILYYTSIRPFDAQTLKKYAISGKILVCEPYYKGALASTILESLYPMPCTIAQVGVPHAFLEHYGTVQQQDDLLGLTASAIKKAIEELIL